MFLCSCCLVWGFLCISLSFDKVESLQKAELIDAAGVFRSLSGRPQTTVLPGPDRLQAEFPTPTDGEAWLGLVGREVALPIFRGRIPSDATTNMHSDRRVLSVVIIGDNYFK